jgi:hypothetical protein
MLFQGVSRKFPRQLAKVGLVRFESQVRAQRTRVIPSPFSVSHDRLQECSFLPHLDSFPQTPVPSLRYRKQSFITANFMRP